MSSLPASMPQHRLMSMAMSASESPSPTPRMGSANPMWGAPSPSRVADSQ